LTPPLKLGVYRRLDDRLQGLPEHSTLALELHQRRCAALRDVFGPENEVEVLDWGDTSSATDHEYVQLELVGRDDARLAYASVPGLDFLAEKLAEENVEESTADLIKAVVSWLRPKQTTREILDFDIQLSGRMIAAVDPPDRYATVKIFLSDGTSAQTTYL
jgi:hypothetical protein